MRVRPARFPGRAPSPETLTSRCGLVALTPVVSGALERVHLCLASYSGECATPVEPTKRRTGARKLSVEEFKRESALKLGEAAELPESRKVVVAT